MYYKLIKFKLQLLITSLVSQIKKFFEIMFAVHNFIYKLFISFLYIEKSFFFSFNSFKTPLKIEQKNAYQINGKRSNGETFLKVNDF